MGAHGEPHRRQTRVGDGVVERLQTEIFGEEGILIGRFGHLKCQGHRGEIGGIRAAGAWRGQAVSQERLQLTGREQAFDHFGPAHQRDDLRPFVGLPGDHAAQRRNIVRGSQ